MSLPGDYQFVKDGFKCTDEMKSDFKEYGYIILRDVFDEEEIRNTRRVFEETDMIKNYGFGLLGGEVYHYHGKLLYKDAYTGGAHLWHQDYGYWYKNGCLFPDMMTVFIALDKCYKSNGCLQILPGSHKCGRIHHDMQCGQTAANVERVAEIENVLPRKYIEMKPGDALFFHCNLLHSSSANESPDRRWALLLAYNRKSNDPIFAHHHAQYTPIEKVSDNAVKDCKNFSDFSGKEFMDPLATTTSIAAVTERQMQRDT